ncbi:hypothetical protein OG909_08525 [Streptomyces sp. NBC_01754]|uniref:hypothetical protein n=1 Tax=Streptomyces sp. NBC_01754 TaxID=2975930 RepID=UPI002DDC68E9|nr:hypothetical protein [Streptomyces sp. NBC_01754]WSC92334.1 hypothetical protein OG909_08525 [Streptomyces sp. NBC_01754]
MAPRPTGGRFGTSQAKPNATPKTLRTWSRDADDSPAASGASQDIEDELALLRAENSGPTKAEKERQLERKILRRAAAHGRAGGRNTGGTRS